MDEHLTAQWCEAKAADLIRGQLDPWTPPSQGEMQRAAVYAEIAKSLRMAEQAKAMRELTHELSRIRNYGIGR